MPRNHGNNKPALTYSEMVEAEQEKKGSKIYKIEASEFVAERVSNLIGRTTEELIAAATAEPVTLTDTTDIQRRTVAYLKACETTSSFPSIQGLSRSLGLSRQAVYDCIYRNSPSETARWLSLCRDAFSDILAECALKNDCNSIVAIFLQKAQYQWRESVEIVTSPAMPMGEDMDEATLKDRILGSVPAEDFDFDTESEDY